MKKPLRYTLIAAAVFAILLTACDPSAPTGTDPAPEPTPTPTAKFPNMSGTITTAEGIDIANIKVGLFLKGNADGDHPDKNLTLNSDTVNWRIYSQLNDAQTTILTPDASGTVNTADKTFFINFPEPPPVRDGSNWSEGYYAVAWYDDNADGMLSLINNNTGGGEYNRLASKTITLKGEADTLTYVDFAEQDELDSTKYQFKYYKASDTQVYDHITLTEENCGGFNFKIEGKTE